MASCTGIPACNPFAIVSSGSLNLSIRHWAFQPILSSVFSMLFLLFLMRFLAQPGNADYVRATSLNVPFHVNVKVKSKSAPSYANRLAKVPSTFQVKASLVILLPGGGHAMSINALWIARYASSYLLYATSVISARSPQNFRAAVF